MIQPLFIVAAPNGMFNTTVNYMLTFFDSTMGSLTGTATKMAQLMALLGIAFCGVKVAFGTMEIRKGLVGTIAKLFTWMLVMQLFPSVCSGIRTFAIAVGRDAAPVTTDALTNTFVTALQRYENAQEYMKNELADKNGERKKSKSHELIEESPDYLALEKQKQTIKKVLTQMPSGQWVLNLMMPIVDDTGEVVTDRNGNPKYNNIFSSDALFNTILIAVQIMYENQMAFDVMKQFARKDFENAEKNVKTAEDKQNADMNVYLTGDYNTKLLDFPFSALMRTGLVLICSIIAIVLTCICLIQYVMCIIEYSICTSFSILILPCMLMDGLKDYAMRTIGMLLNQGMKLAMITLMMFFNAYTYMQMSDMIITDGTQFGLIQFSYIVFTSLITFALVANAPKLASALLTGQPQMSMGEFVGAAAAIAGGATLAGAAAKKVGSKAEAQAQQGARFVSNRGKDVKQMANSGINAYHATKEAGGNTVMGVLNGMKAAGKTGTKLTGRHMKEMGKTWMDGRGGSILGGDAFRNYDPTPVSGTGKVRSSGAGSATRASAGAGKNGGSGNGPSSKGSIGGNTPPLGGGGGGSKALPSGASKGLSGATSAIGKVVK